MRPKLLLTAVAILNLATGFALGIVWERAPTSFEHFRAEADDHDVDVVRLADVLALPPEKDARVRTILASCRPRIDAVMKDVRPKLEGLHREFISELGEELTPAQMMRLIEEYHRQAGRDVTWPQ